jgi:glucosylceramidase
VTLAFDAGAIGDGLTIEVDETRTSPQEIDGFGAALTGSSAWLISQLPAPVRASLLRELFDTSAGIGLSYLRLPIGATDLSNTREPYTHFEQPEYIDGVLREILAINRHTNTPLKIVASPWSAPPSMKTGTAPDTAWKGGRLREDSFEAYADYLIAFLEKYSRMGIPIDSLTLQNEPHNTGNIPSMHLSVEQAIILIKCHLGPRLHGAGLSTRLLIWDHNRVDDTPDVVPQAVTCPEPGRPAPPPPPAPLPPSASPGPDPGATPAGEFYPLAVLSDSTAASFVHGVAFHCYEDVPAPDVQREVHRRYPDKDMYLTECSGFDREGTSELWDTLWSLATAIRSDARAALLWNLALDEQHGPRLPGDGPCTTCRGLVTVHSREGPKRNEDYYALGHLSKFVTRGARAIWTEARGDGADDLVHVGFANPDGSRALVVARNYRWTDPPELPFTVRWGNRAVTHALAPGAAATLLWGTASAQPLLVLAETARPPPSSAAMGAGEGARQPEHQSPKLTLDLAALDEDGLAGPPAARVAVAYEFCIPAMAAPAAEVQRLDRTARFHQGVRGRVGCGPDQWLVLGSTHQPDWRAVLERLAALDYVARIGPADDNPPAASTR